MPIWKVVTSPSNKYKFSDDRELRADSYSIGGCPEYSNFPTGSQFTGNYTLLGYHSPIGNQQCLVQNDEYSSFQAIVLRANGFAIEAKEIDLDDIDSLTRVGEADSWKESMAIFGKKGNEYILPTLKLYDGTLLTEKQYTVTEEAMKELGFNDGKLIAPGGQFSSTDLFNCPFGRANKESQKCRITASFQFPIDTLVIMYAAAQKSRIDPNAAVFFSELSVKCGCRCAETQVSSQSYHPVEGSTSECTVTTVQRPSLRCDMLGNKVCYHDVSDTWTGVQGKKDALPNGNYACALTPSKITKFTSEYAPRADFNVRPGTAAVQ